MSIFGLPFRHFSRIGARLREVWEFMSTFTTLDFHTRRITNTNFALADVSHIIIQYYSVFTHRIQYTIDYYFYLSFYVVARMRTHGTEEEKSLDRVCRGEIEITEERVECLD